MIFVVLTIITNEKKELADVFFFGWQIKCNNNNNNKNTKMFTFSVE